MEEQAFTHEGRVSCLRVRKLERHLRRDVALELGAKVKFRAANARNGELSRADQAAKGKNARAIPFHRTVDRIDR